MGMKTAEEIQQELWDIYEQLDKVIPKHAQKKAEKDKWEKMRDMTKAVMETNTVGTSETERKRKALCSKEYLTYLESWTSSNLEYQKIEGERYRLEMKSKILISLLSYEKEVGIKRI